MILTPQKTAFRVRAGGWFDCAVRKDGQIIDEWTDHNLVVNEGLDHLLTDGVTGVSWYILLIAAGYTPIATTTYALLGTNEQTGYDEATREVWTPDDSGVPDASHIVTNSDTRATFTITSGSTVVAGAAMVTNSVKGDTATGTALAAALFSGGNKTLDAASELLITYNFQTADDGV